MGIVIKLDGSSCKLNNLHKLLAVDLKSYIFLIYMKELFFFN